MPLSLEARLNLKELELKSLFETIRAINSNASEADLFRIYKFIIHSNQHISKLALYVLDEQWECKTSFGTGHDYSKIPLDQQILEHTETGVHTKGVPYFEEFSKVIPVKHKKNVLAYVFVSRPDGLTEEEDLEIEFIEALSNIIIVAVENKKLVRKEQRQQEYRKQLEIAKNVQALLFPKELPYHQHLKVEASYLPHHTIGGDYYDFIHIDPQTFLLCIADVSGKGIPAAILMSNFQAALRILSRQKHSLENIVKELNLLVMQNSNGENFITAFFAAYDSQTKTMRYINAGHNPPFLFYNGQIERLEKGTTILGGFKKLPFLEVGEVQGLEAFFVFCFTDGFTETYNEKGEEFGDEMLEKFLREHLTLDQREMHTHLISLLNTFKGENAYADDITLLSCKVD
jgi:sigma-B regulation protein RsbU (phosphoserine phosphatase)